MAEYAEQGYAELNYTEGDITITGTKYLRIDVKKSSYKTKTETQDLAFARVEAVQAEQAEGVVVYGDIFDV